MVDPGSPRDHPAHLDGHTWNIFSENLIIRHLNTILLKIITKMKYCSNCGKPVEDGTKFCPECGASLQPEPRKPSNINNEDRWLVTLLLSILVGSLGVHRFYTGNVVTGVLMLLTCGGCGVWTIIDIVMIAGNTYRDGNGNTLK